MDNTSILLYYFFYLIIVLLFYVIFFLIMKIEWDACVGQRHDSIQEKKNYLTYFTMSITHNQCHIYKDCSTKGSIHIMHRVKDIYPTTLPVPEKMEQSSFRSQRKTSSHSIITLSIVTTVAFWEQLRYGGYSAGLFRRNADHVCAEQPTVPSVYALRISCLFLANDLFDRWERKGGSGLSRDAGASACRAALSVDGWTLRAPAVANTAFQSIPYGVVALSGRFQATPWANRRQSRRRRRRRWTTTRRGPCLWARRCRPPCRPRAP